MKGAVSHDERVRLLFRVVSNELAYSRSWLLTSSRCNGRGAEALLVELSEEWEEDGERDFLGSACRELWLANRDFWVVV